MTGASFDSTKTPLQELLARADSGSLQIPDFQRGWVWDDEHIKSLLASVSVSFPIGAAMLLHTGGEYWSFDTDKMRLFNELEREVIKRFEQYQVPVIELKKETPKEAVCLVFERVNTGGFPLTVFELLTASFAADDFQLRDDWVARETRVKTQYAVLRKLQSDDFLQAMSLLVMQTRRRAAVAGGTTIDKAPGITCKRKDILKLEVADWEAWADRVEDGFVRAARFLYGQKIFKARDLPYRTQLVPLAAILADLGKDGETEGARRGGGTRYHRRVELPGWPPLTLRTRNSSAYKGLYALLMRDGGPDFRTGESIEAQAFFDDKIDIHHIFPEKWCKTAHIDAVTYNSIINKAAISARTTRQIGGGAPSEYLPVVEKAADIESERMDEILASHCIASEILRTDRFWAFYAARAESLLQRTKAATAKKITREPELFGAGSVAEIYDEGPIDWEIVEPLEVTAS